MSLNLAGLTAYTDEHKIDLIGKSILKGRTIDIINLQTGIKNSATINLLSSSPTFAAGACGWSEAGTTSLTQRVLAVTDIKLNESVCLTDLEDYYTSAMMKAGSYNEEMPFEEIYSLDKVNQVSSFIDGVAWQGDTAGAVPYNLADGFLKTMLADASVVDVVLQSYAAADIVDAVDALVAAIDSDVIDAEDLTLFMSYANYRTYAKALRDANLFHYTGAEGDTFEMFVPGTNVKAMAVKGITSTEMILSPASNLYMGTDLVSDMEDFSIFYSNDNDEVRTRIKFKIGFNYAFSEFVVRGTTAAA